MIKSIIVCSREVFKRLSSVDTNTKSCISISGQDICYSDKDLQDLKNAKDRYNSKLSLCFYDVEKPSDKFDTEYLFNESKAKDILDFIDFIDLHEDGNLIIHCDAGISRSVAIGMFLQNTFNYNVVYLECYENRPAYYNKLVYNTLEKVHFDRCYNV